MMFKVCRVETQIFQKYFCRAAFLAYFCGSINTFNHYDTIGKKCKI